MPRALLPSILVSVVCAACSQEPDRAPVAPAAATADASDRDVVPSAPLDSGGLPLAEAGAPQDPDTWDGFARGFFADYCVSCHGAGNAKRDYTRYDQVLRDAAEIRCGVAPVIVPGCTGIPKPKQFPIGTGAHPDDATRRRLVAWIDDGATER